MPRIINAFECSDTPDLAGTVQATVVLNSEIYDEGGAQGAAQDAATDWPPRLLANGHPILATESWDSQTGTVRDTGALVFSKPEGTNNTQGKSAAILEAGKARWPDQEVFLLDTDYSTVQEQVPFMCINLPFAQTDLESWMVAARNRIDTVGLRQNFYPVLTPQYDAGHPTLAGQYIPSATWQAMLDHAWFLSSPFDYSKRKLMLVGGRGQAWAAYIAQGDWYGATSTFITNSGAG